MSLRTSWSEAREVGPFPFRTSRLIPKKSPWLHISFGSNPIPVFELHTETMIVRRVIRFPATRRFQVCSRTRILPAKPRQYSTSTSSTTAATPVSTPSMLGAFTNELDKIAPKFEIHGSQIQILRSPAEFYETLKVETNVQQRIVGYKLMTDGYRPRSSQQKRGYFCLHCT